MTTARSKAHCVTCGKEKIAYKCEGCLQYFCFIHLPDHHQELGKQFDEIEDKYNIFREAVNEQTQNPQKYSLIEQINKWENDSIDKIRQTAEKARQLLMKYTNEYINEIEIKLSKLTKELEKTRGENDFNEIDLNEFKQKLEELKEKLNKPSNISIQQDSSSFINIITVSTISDVTSIGEVKPSAEQIDRANKLQLPSTFYLYENKEPCKGCRGCEEDTLPLARNENKTTTTTKKPTDIPKIDTKPSVPQILSTASVSKIPFNSSENIKFSFTSTEKFEPQLQTQTSTAKKERTSVESSLLAPKATSQYGNKPSIFGNFSGTAGTSIFGSTTSLNNSNGLIFGGAPALKSGNNTNGSIFGGTPALKPGNNTNGGYSFPGFGGTAAAATTPSAGFQFSTPAATPTSTAATTANTSSTFIFGSTGGAPTNQPLFGNSPKFSFSDLVKQTPSSDKTSNGIKQRVFAGQGSLIFGTNTSVVNTTTTGNNNEDDDGEDEDDDDSYEPNVSFKPIVTLSAVEVKTDEEDENVLFCERAKLYCFDLATNQMKERGTGEIKILQHKTRNICRILMRREQVLKLCANHRITSQIELKPHRGSENAYVWSAMDYAEGEAKHETFCVRFKSSDTAKRFMKQFNDAKQGNANAQQ